MSRGPAIGVQRLSLLPREVATELLERGVAAGIAWLDTADVYGDAPGDAEALLAPFAGRARIATKGGLVRQGRQWRPDGRASHLESACLRSADRLGVDTIDRYLLHAPDPRTDVRVSARALRRLAERGVVREVGLCNVTVGQLRAVLAEVPVACVQVEVSPLSPFAVRSGVVEACRELGIEVWAHRPLGGVARAARLLRDDAVQTIAAKHGAPPGAVVLAWLADLGLVPLPGPTRAETLDACVAATSLRLDDEDRARLDALGAAGRQLRRPRHQRAPRTASDREVRIVMGCPGAGKSSRVVAWDGWARLNRDERGGTLEDLLPALDTLLAAGAERVVLDNTYPSRAARNAVIETAWAHGVPVTCEVLATSRDDAEVNAVLRILDRLGRLPGPDEIPALTRRDPAIVPPRALGRYHDLLEPPLLEEGFARVEVVPFVRRPWTGSRTAVLLDPRDLVPAEVPALRARLEAGGIALVVGWGPEPAEAVEARARDLGLEVHAAMCPHPAGPPRCWCRKPLPGLALQLFRVHDCDPTRSIAWGTSSADRLLARKLGVPLRA